MVQLTDIHRSSECPDGEPGDDGRGRLSWKAK